MQTPKQPLGSNPDYTAIGGEEGVQRLVHRFYQHMDSLPEAVAVRALHPDDLSGSEQKLYWFLSAWFGGPKLYQQHVGEPMMRRRHLHIKIGIKERDQWLSCMYAALDEHTLEEAQRATFKTSFLRMADHMRNMAGDQDPNFLATSQTPLS